MEPVSSNAFQKIISEILNNSPACTETINSTIIPSNSSNCAKLREFNRLESIGIAQMAVENENEILEALDFIEWNIRLMSCESDYVSLKH